MYTILTVGHFFQPSCYHRVYCSTEKKNDICSKHTIMLDHKNITLQYWRY